MNVNIREYTDADELLDSFDHTALNSVATCPRYGAIRYGLSKTFSTTARAMPLEAGRALHEVFAAIRCAEFIDQIPGPDGSRHELAGHAKACAMFGRSRWEAAWSQYIKHHADRDRALGAMCIEIIEGGSFYDDPRDKRRTVQNLQDCAVAYAHRYPFGKHPVWHSENYTRIGIEVGFQFVIESDVTPPFRYTGRIDGIHWYPGPSLRIHDGKTTSRITEAWEQTFTTSHQMTGYCVAATMFTGTPVWEGIVDGLAVPLPTSIDFGGIIRIPYSRAPIAIDQWATWACNRARRMRADILAPLDAEMYTHSCNRFFRPCSMLPLCAAITRDEQQQALHEMVIDRWDPLTEAVVSD